MYATYQTIINEINQIPVVFLQDVYNILHNYHVRVNQKEQNRSRILKFAGAWKDLSEKDFLDIISEMKHTRNEMFSREIVL